MCTSCFQKNDSDNISSAASSSNHNMSLFGDTSFMSSQGMPNQQFVLPQFNGSSQQFGTPFMSSLSGPRQQQPVDSAAPLGYQPFAAVSHPGRPPLPPQSVPAPSASAITAENLGGLMQKPISELTVADIIQINRISNSPIQQQLNTIESDLKKKIQNLDNRINVLEKRNTSIEEENTVLRDTICNIQKSLNKIDSNVRNKNVIITGLPEGEIATDDGPMSTDLEKINMILKITENRDFDERDDDFTASRLGVPKPGYNRVVKIELTSMEERDKFLKDTVKMKEAPAPWNKVFVKKDQHPVYLNENNRLRKKVSDLKKIQGNENKDIKIANGKVMIDNVVVDQNLFFR